MILRVWFSERSADLQEENEIPSSVFVKDPPPFPRDDILEEGDESAPGVTDCSRSQEGGLHVIELSSDEDVGLEAELDEEVWPHDLENMEKSRAEKLKRSSLKKVKHADRWSVRQVEHQTAAQTDRCNRFSPSGGQSEEGLLQAEH